MRANGTPVPCSSNWLKGLLRRCAPPVHPRTPSTVLHRCHVYRSRAAGVSDDVASSSPLDLEDLITRFSTYVVKLNSRQQKVTPDREVQELVDSVNLLISRPLLTSGWADGRGPPPDHLSALQRLISTAVRRVTHQGGSVRDLSTRAVRKMCVALPPEFLVGCTSAATSVLPDAAPGTAFRLFQSLPDSPVHLGVTPYDVTDDQVALVALCGILQSALVLVLECDYEENQGREAAEQDWRASLKFLECFSRALAALSFPPPSWIQVMRLYLTAQQLALSKGEMDNDTWLCDLKGLMDSQVEVVDVDESLIQWVHRDFPLVGFDLHNQLGQYLLHKRHDVRAAWEQWDQALTCDQRFCSDLMHVVNWSDQELGFHCFAYHWQDPGLRSLRMMGNQVMYGRTVYMRSVVQCAMMTIWANWEIRGPRERQWEGEAEELAKEIGRAVPNVKDSVWESILARQGKSMLPSTHYGEVSPFLEPVLSKVKLVLLHQGLQLAVTTKEGPEELQSCSYVGPGASLEALKVLYDQQRDEVIDSQSFSKPSFIILRYSLQAINFSNLLVTGEEAVAKRYGVNALLDADPCWKRTLVPGKAHGFAVVAEKLWRQQHTMPTKTWQSVPNHHPRWYGLPSAISEDERLKMELVVKYRPLGEPSSMYAWLHNSLDDCLMFVDCPSTSLLRSTCLLGALLKRTLPEDNGSWEAMVMATLGMNWRGPSILPLRDLDNLLEPPLYEVVRTREAVDALRLLIGGVMRRLLGSNLEEDFQYCKELMDLVWNKIDRYQSTLLAACSTSPHPQRSKQTNGGFMRKSKTGDTSVKKGAPVKDKLSAAGGLVESCDFTDEGNTDGEEAMWRVWSHVPVDVGVCLDLALACSARGDHQGAIHILTRLIRLATRSTMLHWSRYSDVTHQVLEAGCLSYSQYVEESVTVLKAMRKVLRLTLLPGLPWLGDAVVGKCLDQGDLGRAVEVLPLATSCLSINSPTVLRVLRQCVRQGREDLLRSMDWEDVVRTYPVAKNDTPACVHSELVSALKWWKEGISSDCAEAIDEMLQALEGGVRQGVWLSVLQGTPGLDSPVGSSPGKDSKLNNEYSLLKGKGPSEEASSPAVQSPGLKDLTAPTSGQSELWVFPSPVDLKAVILADACFAVSSASYLKYCSDDPLQMSGQEAVTSYLRSIEGGARLVIDWKGVLVDLVNMAEEEHCEGMVGFLLACAVSAKAGSQWLFKNDECVDLVRNRMVVGNLKELAGAISAREGGLFSLMVMTAIQKQDYHLLKALLIEALEVTTLGCTRGLSGGLFSSAVSAELHQQQQAETLLLFWELCVAEGGEAPLEEKRWGWVMRECNEEGRADVLAVSLKCLLMRIRLSHGNEGVQPLTDMMWRICDQEGLVNGRRVLGDVMVDCKILLRADQVERLIQDNPSDLRAVKRYQEQGGQTLVDLPKDSLLTVLKSYLHEGDYDQTAKIWMSIKTSNQAKGPVAEVLLEHLQYLVKEGKYNEAHELLGKLHLIWNRDLYQMLEEALLSSLEHLVSPLPQHDQHGAQLFLNLLFLVSRVKEVNTEQLVGWIEAYANGRGALLGEELAAQFWLPLSSWIDRRNLPPGQVQKLVKGLLGCRAAQRGEWWGCLAPSDFFHLVSLGFGDDDGAEAMSQQAVKWTSGYVGGAVLNVDCRQLTEGLWCPLLELVKAAVDKEEGTRRGGHEAPAMKVGQLAAVRGQAASPVLQSLMRVHGLALSGTSDLEARGQLHCQVVPWLMSRGHMMTALGCLLDFYGAEESHSQEQVVKVGMMVLNQQGVMGQLVAGLDPLGHFEKVQRLRHEPTMTLVMEDSENKVTIQGLRQELGMVRQGVDQLEEVACGGDPDGELAHTSLKLADVTYRILGLVIHSMPDSTGGQPSWWSSLMPACQRSCLMICAAAGQWNMVEKLGRSFQKISAGVGSADEMLLECQLVAAGQNQDWKTGFSLVRQLDELQAVRTVQGNPKQRTGHRPPLPPCSTYWVPQHELSLKSVLVATVRGTGRMKEAVEKLVAIAGASGGTQLAQVLGQGMKGVLRKRQGRSAKIVPAEAMTGSSDVAAFRPTIELQGQDLPMDRPPPSTSVSQDAVQTLLREALHLLSSFPPCTYPPVAQSGSQVSQEVMEGVETVLALMLPHARGALPSASATTCILAVQCYCKGGAPHKVVDFTKAIVKHCREGPSGGSCPADFSLPLKLEEVFCGVVAELNECQQWGPALLMVEVLLVAGCSHITYMPLYDQLMRAYNGQEEAGMSDRLESSQEEYLYGHIGDAMYGEVEGNVVPLLRRAWWEGLAEKEQVRYTKSLFDRMHKAVDQVLMTTTA